MECSVLISILHARLFLQLAESGQSNPALLTEPAANLLLAIIHLALSDANQTILPKPTDKRYHYRWQANIDARREARAWLHSLICTHYLELLGSSVIPPKLCISEWADNFRRLSPEAASEPGDWKTDSAPYQRDIMDVLNDPNITTIVVMSSAQIGKTELLLNTIGYYADQDPPPCCWCITLHNFIKIGTPARDGARA